MLINYLDVQVGNEEQIFGVLADCRNIVSLDLNGKIKVYLFFHAGINFFRWNNQ